jgi:peptidoglycan/xylan/chitin deacetylase (PgdA/CDA1 family)
VNQPVKQNSEFIAHHGFRARARDLVRDGAVFALSLGKSINSTSGWIRFPYYHHVFDDERAGFSRQLDYLKQHGDFISLSNAVSLLESGATIDGRFFCITFDDGFKNNLTNAVPILLDKKAPAAFFLTTDYIGLDVDVDQQRLLDFYDHRQTLMEFLNWDDCKKMIAAGMEIGSHTMGHTRLSGLQEDDVRQQLAASKKVIESNLDQRCVHFCSPFGIPGRDFDPQRDPALVRAAGYKSMLTTERGAMRSGDDPFRVRRDHMLANWGVHQLRYFLSQN